MATNVDTELNEFPINSVASDELLRQMETAGLLEPNQLYFTPDEEVENNHISSEVIYDKSSSDSSINLGYTSGISNNTTISKDFSKYKQLYVFTSDGSFVMVNLIVPKSSGYYSQNVYMSIYSSGLICYKTEITISLDKTQLTFKNTYQSSATSSNYNTNIFCIIGVY